MDRDIWLQTGVDKGYCSPPVCATHDGLPTDENEAALWEEGWDPCVPAVRLLEESPG